MQGPHEAGVPLAMGSDAGTPLNFHGENGLEIYWMQQAGMTAMEAVVSATGNAACALGWDAWLGTLESGKVADLVVFDENPLDDLRILADKKRLQFVVKDGRVAVIRRGLDVPTELLDRHVIQV